MILTECVIEIWAIVQVGANMFEKSRLFLLKSIFHKVNHCFPHSFPHTFSQLPLGPFMALHAAGHILALQMAPQRVYGDLW
jgi:hypothetical protein